jgi:excisionase family DNA binding protein
MATKSVFTTGEVARICNISQQTVIRCFDSGRIKGFKVPGSKFRRVPRTELLAFMKANGIPPENIDVAFAPRRRRVLIVDDEIAIVELLIEVLAEDERFEAFSATNGFDAGVKTQELRPDIVLLDYMLPDINGNVVCQRIRKNPDLAHTRIIIVSGAASQAERQQLLDAGANEFIRKPFDVTALVTRMAELLGV